MKIKPEVLEVLNASTTAGNLLFLPDGQLERSLYMAVNKALEAIGAKWNRKSKAHVFDHQLAADALGAVLATGEYVDVKKELQFFPTPAAIVDRMIELGGVGPTDDVLEPSAGHGAIVDGLLRRGVAPGGIVCVEIDPSNAATLASRHHDKPIALHIGDFMQRTPEQIDGPFAKIIMNPPFSGQQDIDHVTHALGFLAPGGTLVAIMSEGTFFRDNAKAKAFRLLLEEKYETQNYALDAGAFKESGTGVRTRIVVVKS